ncbi:phage tail protein, partial [Salmonella enterica subsp. diarizonae]|nr:phage tail protein [Salmonella enterica subsp. diarizonae]
MIEIETIPGSTRKPGVYAEFNTRMAMRSLPGNPQRMLIVAPLSGGSA